MTVYVKHAIHEKDFQRKNINVKVFG